MFNTFNSSLLYLKKITHFKTHTNYKNQNREKTLDSQKARVFKSKSYLHITSSVEITSIWGASCKNKRKKKRKKQEFIMILNDIETNWIKDVEDLNVTKFSLFDCTESSSGLVLAGAADKI